MCFLQMSNVNKTQLLNRFITQLYKRGVKSQSIIIAKVNIKQKYH